MSAIDVSLVVQGVTDNLVSIGAVGAACLLIFLGIRAFKWVKMVIGGGSGVMTQAESDQYFRDLDKAAPGGGSSNASAWEEWAMDPSADPRDEPARSDSIEEADDRAMAARAAVGL